MQEHLLNIDRLDRANIEQTENVMLPSTAVLTGIHLQGCKEGKAISLTDVLSHTESAV